MTSKIQQAKNEKLLKELARLSENKRCAICTCMGTQYTCQPPSIFICSTCAGAMYHFPGFRVKSRSMATYTAQEVQQMKEGGNALFSRQYLAKWNASSFPAPLDKNPKKVEDFIRQVLVDKVFYSEEALPVENKEPVRRTESIKSSIIQRQRTLSPTSPAEISWEAFPSTKEDVNTSNSGQSTLTGTGGHWAEFSSNPAGTVAVHRPPPAAAAPPIQSSSFDPFGLPSQDLASPKSAQSALTQQNQGVTPPAQEKSWDFFQDAPPVVQNSTVVNQTNIPTGWSSFETTSVGDSGGSGTIQQTSGNLDNAQQTTVVSNEATKAKSPALDPLPEEWFSVNSSPAPSFNDTGFQTTTQQAFVQPVQTHPYPVYPPGSNLSPPHASAFAFAHQQLPPPALGSFPSFKSTAIPTVAGVGVGNVVSNVSPPSWNMQTNMPTLQSQDSMQSYVSARVDETAHNPLFQNLDMDMRAKAHSVAGVPIQTRHGFQNGAFSATSNIARPDVTTVQIQQSFMQQQPQRNFGEASGNPFA